MAEAPSAMREPVAELMVLVGPDEGRRFQLFEGTTHVGRSLDCEVVLNDRSASRKHFRLEALGSTVVLVDLGSENGTSVNGAQVRRQELNAGAQISAGTTLLHFGPVGAPAPATEAPDRAPEGLVTSPWHGRRTPAASASWSQACSLTILVTSIPCVFYQAT